ncbi:hypothetical protein STENM223S_11549 [Streptomyces tendae]
MSFGDPNNPYGQPPQQPQPGLGYGYPQQPGQPAQPGYGYPAAPPVGQPYGGGYVPTQMPGITRAAQILLAVIAVAHVIIAAVYGVALAQWDELVEPANVLLMADGSVRLADFNMAAELEGTHAYTSAFSTPDYTPPELLWSGIGERGRRYPRVRRRAGVRRARPSRPHRRLPAARRHPGGPPHCRRRVRLRHRRAAALRGLPDAWRDVVRACLTRTHAERIGVEDLLRRVREAAGAGRPSAAAAARAAPPLAEVGRRLGGRRHGHGGAPRVRRRPLGLVRRRAERRLERGSERRSRRVRRRRAARQGRGVPARRTGC